MRPPPALALAAPARWRRPPPPPPPTSGQCPPRPGPARLLPLQQGQLFPSAGPGPGGISNSDLSTQPHLGVGVSAQNSSGFPDWSRIAPSSVRTLVPFTSAFLTQSCPETSSCPLAGSRIPVQPGTCRRLGLGACALARPVPARPRSPSRARTSLRSSLVPCPSPSWALSSHQLAWGPFTPSALALRS